MRWQQTRSSFLRCASSHISRFGPRIQAQRVPAGLRAERVAAVIHLFLPRSSGFGVGEGAGDQVIGVGESLVHRAPGRVELDGGR